MTSKLNVAFAQIAPVWLNRQATIDKVIVAIESAANQQAQLVAFGEALLPGYPFWLDLTGGSKFNSTIQKEIHAHYIRNAISIESGDLDDICSVCKQHKIATYLGTIERAENRGGKSLYCSMVYIDQLGVIGSVHRKLMPTYEERLTWSPGDGHGLQVHNLTPFKVGGLNCWENWMPLARSALYAQGEDLHVAIWPGSKRNTDDITRYIAKESRSFVVSASGLMRPSDFPKGSPHLDKILAEPREFYSNGGSCIAGPDGEWVIFPIIDEEVVRVACIDHDRVLEERQNFDPSGHYSRPDVTKLIVNRERQAVVEFKD